MFYIMFGFDKGIKTLEEDKGMNNTIQFTEKPLNAKYYAMDQDVPYSKLHEEANDFITKLSTFMVSAMNILTNR